MIKGMILFERNEKQPLGIEPTPKQHSNKKGATRESVHEPPAEAEAATAVAIEAAIEAAATNVGRRISRWPDCSYTHTQTRKERAGPANETDEEQAGGIYII
ncbi:hypothetical protein PCANC_18282 [Puccinia coronata f. sp. avenae]|uniref:Uncharacterized protein n=1 Tax=Puccinia coronata f. sp. avenae TaxID=200324 RepID=A0A2N5UTB5_9BASI|nr:hypothetical protein PCANC_21707 [Puccinia coronata f. sp. avenae]PLW36632.1 hypothetical protein PCANC_18282 [Puccinia coronata f. sp. avenae]PLW40984.1 hypothetical protein PCASD_06627 [Puccinia coronata f. sp. avenae]